MYIAPDEKTLTLLLMLPWRMMMLLACCRGCCCWRIWRGESVTTLLLRDEYSISPWVTRIEIIRSLSMNLRWGRAIPHWGEWLWNRRVEHWAIRSSVRSFACTAHSLACSALLASLARSAALIHSLARSLQSWWERDFCLKIECVDFILFQPTVHSYIDSTADNSGNNHSVQSSSGLCVRTLNKGNEIMEGWLISYKLAWN